jgi:methyl-accepting chemotaxis protein
MKIGSRFFRVFCVIFILAGIFVGLAVFLAGQASQESDATLILLASGAVLLIVIAAFGRVLSQDISKSAEDLTKLTGSLTTQAKGRQDSQGLHSLQEFKEIAQTLTQAATDIQKLRDFLKDWAQYISRGGLGAKVPKIELEGNLGEIAQTAEKTIKDFMDDFAITAAALEKLATGDLAALAALEKFKQPRPIEKPLDALTDTVKNIQNDISTLTTNAAKGNFQTAISDAKYQNIWKDMVSNLNTAFKAVPVQLGYISEALTQLSKGNLEAKITQETEGDFQKLKTTFDSTTTALTKIVNDIYNTLNNPQSRTRVSSDFPGDFAKIKQAITNPGGDAGGTGGTTYQSPVRAVGATGYSGSSARDTTARDTTSGGTADTTSAGGGGRGATTATKFTNPEKAKPGSGASVNRLSGAYKKEVPKHKSNLEFTRSDFGKY